MNPNTIFRAVTALLLSLLPFYYSFSQNAKINTTPLIGRSVSSVIQMKTSSAPVLTDSSAKSARTASSMAIKEDHRFIWEIVFDPDHKVNTKVIKKMKRIVFAVDMMGNPIKYDSDDVDKSGFGLQMATIFDPLIGETSERLVKNNNEPVDAPSTKLDKMGTKYIPIYDSTFFWNGLLFSPLQSKKMEKGLKWKTELAMPDKIIRNEYTIQSCDADSIVVNMKSYETASDTTKAGQKIIEQALPMGGSSGTKFKQQDYDGNLTIDTKTLLVIHANFTIVQVINTSMNGQVSEKKSYFTSNVTNTIK